MGYGKLNELYKKAIKFVPDILELTGAAVCCHSSVEAGGPWHAPETSFNVAVGGLFLSDVVQSSSFPEKLPDSRFRGLLLKAMATGIKYKATFGAAAFYVSTRYAIRNWKDAAWAMGEFAVGIGLGVVGDLVKRQRAKRLDVIVNEGCQRT